MSAVNSYLFLFIIAARRSEEADRVADRPRLHGTGQGQRQPVQLRRVTHRAHKPKLRRSGSLREFSGKNLRCVGVHRICLFARTDLRSMHGIEERRRRSLKRTNRGSFFEPR